jgi:hypothetical protein
MTKKEFQEKHGFIDEDMERIELAKSITGGRITDIFNEPLKYQDIKISIKKA